MITISEITIKEKYKESMIDFFTKKPKPANGETEITVQGYKISEREIIQEMISPIGQKFYSHRCFDSNGIDSFWKPCKCGKANSPDQVTKCEMYTKY